MPKFKVKILRIRPRITNPFKPLNIHQKIEIDVRIWEIEAENEAQIKKYFKEAVEANLPNVRGFELASIEEM